MREGYVGVTGRAQLWVSEKGQSPRRDGGAPVLKEQPTLAPARECTATAGERVDWPERFAEVSLTWLE
jgi:hypothetical protein